MASRLGKEIVFGLVVSGEYFAGHGSNRETD